MAIDLHFRKNVRYLAITVDDICGPYNTHRLLPIQILFLPYPISFQDFVASVAGQGEIQLILGLELLECLDAVAAYT